MTKVSILAGSIAAIASLIVGTLIVNGSAEIVYQDSLNRLKYETNLKSIRLINYIKNLSGDTQYLVGTPPIQGIPRAIFNKGIDPDDNSSLATWQKRLTTIFTELIRAKPNYLQIRYIGVANNGKELIRVDRQGELIKTIPANQLQEKGHTSYFKNAIKKNPGEIYLSDISLNREYGKISKPHTPVIRVASPVYYNDSIFGILIINMAFTNIFNDLVINTPRELIPYVINEEGFFLAHPDRSMTYGFDLNHKKTINSIYPDIDLTKYKDIRDQEFTINMNNDVIHIVRAHYDPTDFERYFSVILSTNVQNLQAKSQQLRYQGFIIMGILVLASLFIARILAFRLLRPLKLISVAAEDLANGRTVTDLPVTSVDEIGELARSFDNMRLQLEEKKRELITSQGHVHHANKMASLGEMASGMAHEINSPIQTITLIAERVQAKLNKDLSKEDINQSMEKITASVSKISEIIDSLKKVSRNSTDEQYTITSLKELVDDTVNMTRERFKVNNVKFDIEYKDTSENTLVQCQRLQISQVLINLVNNAYDAISELDTKWIKISFEKDTSKLKISVSDSGNGIPEELHQKIFEPMFTTKDIGHGTGLGLSISRDIIKKHNGEIYVDSHSKNTRIIIEIPLIQNNK